MEYSDALRDAATEAALRAAVGVLCVLGGACLILSAPAVLIRCAVRRQASEEP
jgi:hypothetical protein